MKTPSEGAMSAAHALAFEEDQQGRVLTFKEMAEVIDCLAVQPEREQADRTEARVKDLEETAERYRLTTLKYDAELAAIRASNADLAEALDYYASLSDCDIAAVAVAALARHRNHKTP